MQDPLSANIGVSRIVVPPILFQLARAQLQDQMDKIRQQIARDAKEDRVSQGRLEERHGQEVARLEERHGKMVAELKEQHGKEMQKLNDDWEEEQVVEMNLLDTELERLRDERCVLLFFSVHLSGFVIRTFSLWILISDIG